MLRLVHTQKSRSSILVDDIDDGLSNKRVHRLGSTADPKAYDRDGYALLPKQPCYIPRVDRHDSNVPGYIDLKLTESVVFSAGKGKIKKMVDAGLITTLTFVAADLTAPVVGAAILDTPGAGDVTISGTDFLSLHPTLTSVVLTGTGATTLTQVQILAGGGTITGTSIVLPAALVPGVALTTTLVSVKADNQASASVALT